MLNLTIAALGGLIALSPYIIASNVPTFFLVASLFFLGLALSQIRFVSIASVLSRHIRTIITPRVLSNLSQMQDRPDFDATPVMNWEVQGRNVIRPRNLLLVPIAGAHFAIPLFGSMLSIGIFLEYWYRDVIPVLPLDFILFVLCIGTFFYTVYWGYKAGTEW